MAQKKLYRFAQLKTFPNVLENPPDMKGRWKDFFNNDNQLILELACGRGEYTIGLAQLYPDKNFLGIDIKGNRMYIGARKALDNNLQNAGFLRSQIEKLTEYFDHAEVGEIWITFPDPQLRTSKAKKRLTHPRFLRLYSQILKPGGKIHLKTDSPDLFNFTKMVIEMYGLITIVEIDNVYSDQSSPAELRIKTHYEGMDIAGSNKIYYLQFSLSQELPMLDDQLKVQLTNAGQAG